MASRARSEEDELRAALQVDVAHICTQDDGGPPMTKSAIQAITELTYLYATTSLANDLAAFSQHANRRTITPDDVMLVARRNEELLTKLKEYASSISGLPQSAPVVAKAKAASHKSRLQSLNPRKATTKNSLSSCDDSSSSSLPTKRKDTVRKSMLIGSDSEQSSEDNSVPLIPTQNGKISGAVTSISESNKPQLLLYTSKRKIVDSTDEEGDQVPIARKRRKSLTTITKQRTMEDISAFFSSDDDSLDF